MNHGLGCSAIKQALVDIPQLPGIYKMIDSSNNIIYIGKANNLRNRVSSYTKTPFASLRTEKMVEQVARVEIIITGSEDEALLLEARLIRSLQPKYNVMLKDDKTYPFIAMDTSTKFPRIYRTRFTDKKHAIAGPFASAYEATQALTVIQKICKIRSCTDAFFRTRTRPCVEYQIHRCSAPCVDKITAEEYEKSIQQAISILSGETREVIRNLHESMKQASENEDYERAGMIRDRIFALEKLSSVNTLGISSSGDYIAIFKEDDFCCAQIFRISGGNLFGNISYFFENIEDQNDAEILSALITRHYLIKDIKPMPIIITQSEVADKIILERSILKKYNAKTRIIYLNNINNRKELEEFDYEEIQKFLQTIEGNAEMELRTKLKKKSNAENIFNDIATIFNINTPINNIEVFDNSHTSGGSPLGAIIAANKEGFVKSNYRLFNMDDVDISDDYAMLRATLKHRLKNKPHPDLLIIDGGTGHLNAALGVLREMNIEIPCICISKGKERRASKEKFHIKGKRAFSIRNNEAVFRYMQRLRDEAHRFAISSHVRRRNKHLMQNLPR